MCVVSSTVITNLGRRRGPFIKKLVEPLDTSHDKGRAVCNLPELPPICRKSQFLGCEVLWKTVKKASRVCLLEAFAVLLLVAMRSFISFRQKLCDFWRFNQTVLRPRSFSFRVSWLGNIMEFNFCDADSERDFRLVALISPFFVSFSVLALCVWCKKCSVVFDYSLCCRCNPLRCRFGLAARRSSLLTSINCETFLHLGSTQQWNRYSMLETDEAAANVPWRYEPRASQATDSRFLFIQIVAKHGRGAP